MKTFSAFKRWYSLSEAADFINEAMDDSLTVEDVVELISTGELPAWYDARGLYAVSVAPACPLNGHPSPVLSINGYPTRDHQKLGFVDFVIEKGQVRVLDDYHRIVAIDRFDGVSIPIDGDQAMTVLAGGKLLFDDDDSMLQLVCRKNDAPARSLHSLDFKPDHLSFDREAVLLRAVDLRAAIERVSTALSPLSTSVPEHSESRANPDAQDVRRTDAYQTKLLALLLEGARQWWSSYDPADPTTAPKNDEVKAWFKKNGVADRVAEVMAQILRADGLPTGPRKSADR